MDISEVEQDSTGTTVEIIYVIDGKTSWIGYSAWDVGSEEMYPIDE